MRITLLLLTILLVTASGFSQQQPAVIIEPGVGVGPLKLGMSEEETIAVLKGNITWSDYKSELKSFVDYGTRIDSVMQFIIGFDSCGSYINEAPESMPVFSVYFKNHRLNFITVSSYIAKGNQLENIGFSNGLSFYEPMSSCVERLGTEYLPVAYGEYDGDHYYYKKGMEVVYDENKLTVIGIFSPVPDFKKLIGQKSAALLKRAAAVPKDEDH